jgi:glycosyltransferase involved in cell wall biosynthesis
MGPTANCCCWPAAWTPRATARSWSCPSTASWEPTCAARARPDPLPNAALEAAAAGLCVVAAAHGGLPENVRHGATGVLVPPGDAPALARALAELAADPQRRARLGAAAAADVRAGFAPRAPAGAVQNLYDRLLG